MTNSDQAVRSPFESPRPMAVGRVLRAYALEARYETLHALRTPAVGIPFLVLPVVVYLLFGVVMVSPDVSAECGPAVANYLFSGFCALPFSCLAYSAESGSRSSAMAAS
jgi:hypothetical protein